MIDKEKYLKNYPKQISLNATEKIIRQMKNSVCKLYLNDKSEATGFFCKIRYNNKFLYTLMTNYHEKETLEKEKILLILINNEKKKIELEKREIYINKDCDITIIEVKNEDGINNYLEIDNDIINNISNVDYKKESIYTIQYKRQKEEPSVSYGIIYEINNNIFDLLCSTEEGSSGSPILNINNNKLIGIHKNYIKNKKSGAFLNYPIQEYIKSYNNHIEESNKKANIIINSQKDNSIINKISSSSLYEIFSFLNGKQKLNMIIYTKKLQNMLWLKIEHYKLVSGKLKKMEKN